MRCLCHSDAPDQNRWRRALAVPRCRTRLKPCATARLSTIDGPSTDHRPGPPTIDARPICIGSNIIEDLGSIETSVSLWGGPQRHQVDRAGPARGLAGNRDTLRHRRGATLRAADPRGRSPSVGERAGGTHLHPPELGFSGRAETDCQETRADETLGARRETARALV